MDSAYKSPGSIGANAYAVVAYRLTGNWPYRLANTPVDVNYFPFERDVYLPTIGLTTSMDVCLYSWLVG